MQKFVSIAVAAALAWGGIASPVASQAPSEPPFEAFGRADELARLCQDAEELTGFAFSVGTCLAIARENATNEVATICAYLEQSGFLPAEDEDGNRIETVADCIVVLSLL